MMRTSRWLCVLSIAAAVAFGSAEALAQTDAEKAYLEAQARQAELLKEIANLARSEEEQKALRRELAKIDDELAKERQRANELERELERLTGQPPAVARDAEEQGPAPTVGRQTLAIPERRTNALGIIAQEPAPIGEAPKDATALRLIPLEPDLPKDLAVREHEGRLVFSNPTALGTSVPLAELALRDGQLWWTWQVGSPLPVEAPLAALDRLLATAEVQALAGTTVVGQYQMAPALRRASLRERSVEVSLPRLAQLPLSLEVAGDGANWATDQPSPTVLHVASRQVAAAIEWRSGEGTLVVRTGPGLVVAQAQASRERAGWEKDLQGLQSAATRDEAEIARVQGELARVSEQQQKLDNDLLGMAADAQSIGLRLVAPNGVVCSEVTLTVN